MSRAFVQAWSCGVVLMASTVWAQTTGSLTGAVVENATRQPIAAQRVTVTSSALMTDRFTLTDDAGGFVFDHLPPGTYRVRVTRAGFRPYRLADVIINPAETTSLEVALVPPQDEDAGVTAPSGIDLTSPAQTVSLSSAFIDRVPVATPHATGLRSYDDLSLVAPHVTRDALGTALNGGLSNEHSTFIDGMQVNDPAFGGLRTPLGVGGAQVPLEFLERVSVTTSGSSPLFSRGSGSAVNAVLKSGSNELHGSVFGSWWPGSLTANARGLPNETTAFDFSSKRHNTGDFGAEVSGAIVKDRLWFFAGVVQSADRRRVTRSTKGFLLASDGSFARDEFRALQTEAIESASVFDDRRSTTWVGKLTWRLSDTQTISFTALGGPQLRQVAPFEALTDGARDTTDSVTTSLRYLGRFVDDALTVEATVGYGRTSHRRLPFDADSTGTPRTVFAGDLQPSLEGLGLSDEALARCRSGEVRCPATSINAPLIVGGRGLLVEADADRLQARGVVGWRFRLLGRHLARAGVDADWSQHRSVRTLSGELLVVERQGAFDLIRSPTPARSTISQLSAGAFVDEQWRILDALVLNAGLRFDTQRFFDASQSAFAVNQVSPRLGLVYDVAQNGRGKVFGHYAVYSQALPFEAVRPAIDGSARLSSSASTCDALDSRHGCTSAVTVEQRAGSVSVDPALKPMTHAELSAGLEYELLPRFTVGLLGTHRWLVSSVELLSTDDGASVFLGTPGVGLAKDFAPADRKYFAGTLFASREFQGGWLAQGSYTLSTLSGNTAGVFRQGPARTDTHLTSATPNEFGFLPNDTTHQVKLAVAKDFEVSSDVTLLVGASYQGFSGTPVSYLAQHPVAGFDATYVLPRGSAGRTPWTHSMNLRAGLTWKWSAEQSMQVNLDVMNLFNLQEATELDQRLSARQLTPVTLAPGQDPREAACLSGNSPTCRSQLSGPAGQPWPLLNPTFKQPLAYQQPLSVRLGLRFTF